MKRLAPLVLLLGILGCAGVQPADIAGTWIIKSNLREFLPPQFRSAVGKIVLNADGTFTAAELPQDRHTNADGASRLIPGGGVWKLLASGELILQFRDLVGPDGKSHGPYGFGGIVVFKRWSAVHIYYDFADPTEIRIEFEKQ